MYDFSLINIVMNNGVKYSIVSSLDPNQVIIYIKEHTKNGLVTIKGLNDYVVLNKGKIVGIDVKPIRR